MKRSYLLLLAVLTCFFAACSDDDDKGEQPVNDVTVSISAATTTFKVAGNDVTAEFTLTADKAAPANLVIAASVEGATEGTEYTLDPAAFVIAKGATTATGSIKFLAAGFTSSTSKSVKLNISSRDAKIGIGSVTFTVSGNDTPDIPDVTYGDVTVSWNAYAGVIGYGIGTLVATKEITDESGYTDLSKTSIAYINKDNNMAYVTVDQHETGAGDPYIAAMWVDWNGDGKFDGAGEEPLYEEWAANGTKSFVFALNPPTNAVKMSRIRFGLFFAEDDTDIENGVGNIDSGDILDVTYSLSDEHVEDPEAPEDGGGNEPDPGMYCLPEVGYSPYGVCGGYKIGNVTVENKEKTGYEGWTDMIATVAKLSVGENEVSITADQSNTGTGDPYIVAMWIDFNGNGSFDDDGEQVIYEEWSAEGVKTFTKTITVPADAVESSRVRFGVYFAEGKTNLVNGCGTIDSGDLIDITYTLK